MRKLITIGIAFGLSACVAAADTEAPEARPEGVDRSEEGVLGGWASLAGASGPVTTLAYYGGGGVHPGVNAIDIGAPGGSSVFHQLDYLPASVAGGWVHVAEVHDPGLCSQWYPGSAYYNGAKIVVSTYFYDASGSYLGWHRAAYQHVSPYGPNMNAWWTWNNAGATKKAWPGGAHLGYGDGQSGGLYLGAVFSVYGNIYNGPGGGLCTTGSHLHQEADGSRNQNLWVGKQLTARYSDLHFFGLAGGYPPAGAPPSPPPVSDPCGGLDYYGRCVGSLLEWCENGALQSVECSWYGMSCGWVGGSIGHNCY